MTAASWNGSDSGIGTIITTVFGIEKSPRLVRSGALPTFTNNSRYNAGMTEEIQEKPRTKVLKNGAIYDLDKKRITSGAVLNSADAAQMASRKHELKREAIIRGANAVAAEGGKYDGTDLDFIEAIAEVQTIKALNPDDPKSTDAARFIMQESGYAEAKQAQAPAAEAVTDILREVASIAASLASSFHIMSITPNEEAAQGDIIADTVQAGSGGGERGEDTAADGG